MKRDPASHKGDNGRVAIVGGSATQHGAPLFSALAAEASGVDLLYVALPKIHQEVAKMQSLNFQVHPFAGDNISTKDLPAILELLATMDCAVIGPGIARTPATLKALQELISSVRCPMVLDASALQPWTLKTIRGKNAVLTPHLGELERMGIAPDDIANAAAQAGVVIYLKGQADRVVSADGQEQIVSGGNAGLTVGGTGDALAGLICGLIAQGEEPLNACITASTVIKRAGTMLYGTQAYAYTTRDVILQIPHLLRTMG